MINPNGLNALNLDRFKHWRRVKIWSTFLTWNRVSLTTKFKILILYALRKARKILDGYIRNYIELYKNLPKQDYLIQSFNWKTLIILDACRYDVFQATCLQLLRWFAYASSIPFMYNFRLAKHYMERQIMEKRRNLHFRKSLH